MLSKNKIIENLRDAGFDASEIKEFVEFYNSDDTKSTSECLNKKRKELLDKVHKNEKCITCLDYLKYIMENEKNKE